MDISPMKEVQETIKKEVEAQQKNNSIIIDLKIKIDRVNFLLTNLLDINNSEVFKEQIKSNPVLISPEKYNKSQDLVIKLIGEIAPIVEQFYKKEETK
nr:MAG: hypothetical protein [Microvirus Sku218]